MELAALLDEIVKKYKVDQDRIYVTGLSMGGFGTWSLAAYQPNRFAAIVPICGGGEVYWADTLAHIPAWAFHGAKISQSHPNGRSRWSRPSRRTAAIQSSPFIQKPGMIRGPKPTTPQNFTSGYSNRSGRPRRPEPKK